MAANRAIELTRFQFYHKRACSLSSKDLNHSEFWLLVCMFSYMLQRGFKKVGRGKFFDTLTGNYHLQKYYEGYWQGLIDRGFIVEAGLAKHQVRGMAYAISPKGNELIKMYFKRQDELLLKHKPKRAKPLTMAEYFEE